MAAVNIDKELFDKYVNVEKRTVLIGFSAPWCSYCRRIAPAYKQIAEQYGDKIIVGVVNIDEEKELAKLNGIEVIPTFVLYINGQAVSSVTAPDSKAKIEDLIRQHADL